MIINRQWEMPNSKTFRIKCIQDLILKYKKGRYENIENWIEGLE